MLYFDAVIYLSTYVLELLQFEMVIVLLVVDGKACVFTKLLLVSLSVMKSMCALVISR